MANMSAITEVDILTQIVEPEKAGLSPESARAILSLSFNDVATKRIDELAENNRHGSLSADERDLFEKYLRVGNFLNLLRAKARASLAMAKAG